MPSVDLDRPLNVLYVAWDLESHHFLVYIGGEMSHRGVLLFKGLRSGVDALQDLIFLTVAHGEGNGQAVVLVLAINGVAADLLPFVGSGLREEVGTHALGGHQTVGVDGYGSRDHDGSQKACCDEPQSAFGQCRGFLLSQHGGQASVLFFYLILCGGEVPNGQNAVEEQHGHHVGGGHNVHKSVGDLAPVTGFHKDTREQGNGQHVQTRGQQSQ